MISAVLISWKRPQNIPRIVEHLLKQPFFDDILVWDNAKEANLKCYGRYLATDRAKNPFIYVQDDDCIVHGINRLYEAFLANTGLITHGATPEYMANIADKDYGKMHLALVGWGAFFRQSKVAVFDEYIARYGMTDELYRDADRIFTMLQRQKHNTVEVDIEHLAEDPVHDPLAMSSQPDHNSSRDLAIQRCLAL